MEASTKLGELKSNPKVLDEAQLEAFKYIETLTNRLDPRFDQVEMRLFMADGQIIADKAKINEIAFELREGFKEEQVVEHPAAAPSILLLESRINDVKGHVGGDINQQIRSTESRIREVKIRVRDRSNMLNSSIRDLSCAVDELTRLEELKDNGKLDDAMLGELKQILESGDWQLLTINGRGNLLTFATTSSIVQSQVNPAAGLNLHVNLGVICAVLDLEGPYLNTRMGLRNLNLGGVYHPHAHDGNICWGDASDRAAELLGRRQFAEVFKLLTALLTTYAPSNPYRALRDFHRAHDRTGFRQGRRDGSIPEEKYHVLPDNLPIATEPVLPEWDTTSEIHVGQLVWMKATFDSGAPSHVEDKLAIVTNIGYFGGDDLADQVADTLKRKYSLLTLTMEGEAFDSIYGETWDMSRDELAPAVAGEPGYDKFERLRAVMHAHSYPWYGDKVQITSSHLHGNSSSVGHFGRVGNLRGIEGNIRWGDETMVRDCANGGSANTLSIDHPTATFDSNGRSRRRYRSFSFSEFIPIGWETADEERYIANIQPRIDELNDVTRVREKFGCDIAEAAEYYQREVVGDEQVFPFGDEVITPSPAPTPDFTECPNCEGDNFSCDDSGEYDEPWYCSDCEHTWSDE